jgi:two-component system, OmpR family, copper resistance phosphate regulon response regulator CusR
MLMVVDLLDAVTTHWSIHPPYRTLTFSLRFPDILQPRRVARRRSLYILSRPLDASGPRESSVLDILLVEDERKLAEAVAEGLQGEGYAVALSPTGEHALSAMHKRHFDLVLLDVMLPARGGLEVLGDMRRAGLKAPALIITSRDSIEDRVLGLDAGADDYLVKPFAFPELLARVRALMRRNLPAAFSSLQIADLTLELEGRTASRAGKRLELTAREFDLLEYLLLNRGSVVSREMLAREVWKQFMRYTPLDNVIDVQIARLRRKLDGDFQKKLLHTVRGVGFVLREDEP